MFLYLASLVWAWLACGNRACSRLKVKNQGKWPTKVAEYAAPAPCHSTCTPPARTLPANRGTACCPSACIVVFSASTGMIITRQEAEASEARPVLAARGTYTHRRYQHCVDLVVNNKVNTCVPSSRASRATLAAVSPNLASGP